MFVDSTEFAATTATAASAAARVPVGEATIMHADLDAFYASVEQRDDPRLRGKPIAVGGGVVLAASYEAKRWGVRTAMNGGEARRLCPHLIEVPARFEAYTAASTAVFEVFNDTTPLVEDISIDEAFLDVGGLLRLSGAPREIAARLRQRVLAEVGLPITVGVARTKFLAKVASGVAKPDGLLVVDPGAELEFLHPLPVERLWGVGPVTAAKLDNRGIRTVGEVATMSERSLIAIVGTGSGRQLHALAHNRDPRRVETGRRRGSIGSQQALGRRRRSRDEIDVVLRRLVDRITSRMRKAGRVGRTVTLRFRFDDFSRATRSHTVAHLTSSTAVVHSTASALLDAAWPMIETRGITLLGVSVGNLADEGAVQLTLPFERSAADRLDAVVDEVRGRFGGAALNRAVTMKGDPGFTVPMLPD